MKILLVLLMLFSFNSYSSTKDNLFHMYTAAGELYGLGAFRVGRKNWEVGLLNKRNGGIVFLSYSGQYYAGLGGSMNINFIPGIFAALGVERHFWDWLSYRIEMNTGHGFDNYSSSEIHIGISINL